MKTAEEKKEARTASHASEVIRPGFFVKLVLMILIDTLEIYGMLTVYLVKSWTVLVVLVALLLVVNWAYFFKQTIPTKYLVPGMVFLLVYRVFVMGHTGYVSFASYDQGHNSSKADAVASILQASGQRAESTSSLPAAVVGDSNSPGFAVVGTATGVIRVGDSETPLHEVSNMYAAGAISAVGGYKVLTIAEILQPEAQQEVSAIKVPASDNPNDGSYHSDGGSTAYLAKSRYNYNGAADILIDTTTDVVYTASDKIGAFVDAGGNQIDPGWRVFVGFDGYVNMFTRGDLADPFLKALLWSFIFAATSVLSTLALGLILGPMSADKRIKGHKVYQSLMILPYAFPAFLATLAWRGMLDKDFGFINEMLLGGTDIPWLADGMLMKFSILGMNLWLGFLYMFLMCLGTLQSLPGDVEEAAKVNGTSGLRTVWSIKLPLVLQSTAPLLIASFALNFNDLSLTYMLTGDGPNYPDLGVDQTDILTSMAYKIVIEPGSPNYSLTSAMSITVFIVVNVIARLGFRQTKTLEEL